LTIADSDPAAGTITLIVQSIGKTTKLPCAEGRGEGIQDVVGPSAIPRPSRTTEPLRASGRGWNCGALPHRLRAESGREQRPYNHRARTKELVMPRRGMRQCSRAVYVTTDDGSYARRARHRSAHRPSQRAPNPSMRSTPSSPSHDEGGQQRNAPVQRAHLREPQHHHGGRHRHVRRLPRYHRGKMKFGMRGRTGIRRAPGGLRRADDAQQNVRGYGKSVRRAGAPLAGSRHHEEGTRRTDRRNPLKPSERMKIKRQEPLEQPADARSTNFLEVSFGFDEERSIVESTRCLNAKSRSARWLPRGHRYPPASSRLVMEKDYVAR